MNAQDSPMEHDAVEGVEAAVVLVFWAYVFDGLPRGTAYERLLSVCPEEGLSFWERELDALDALHLSHGPQRSPEHWAA